MTILRILFLFKSNKIEEKRVLLAYNVDLPMKLNQSPRYFVLY